MCAEYVDPEVKRRLRDLQQHADPQLAFLEATRMVETGLRYIKEVRDREQARWWTMELFERVDILGGHPEIIGTARTPEQWAVRLATAGAFVSADTIRERALASRGFYLIDEQMLVTPHQLDDLFRAPCNVPYASVDSKAVQRVLARITKSKKRTTVKKGRQP